MKENNKILEKILEICKSNSARYNKINEILDTTLKSLNRNNIPSNQQLLKMARKIIKSKNLNINKLKINKDGNFEFLVYYSEGYAGDWTNKEILTPHVFYENVIKPNI